MRECIIVGGRWKNHNHYDRKMSKIRFIIICLFYLKQGDEIKIRKVLNK
jgi:hypothetical protein